MMGSSAAAINVSLCLKPFIVEDAYGEGQNVEIIPGIGGLYPSNLRHG